MQPEKWALVVTPWVPKDGRRVRDLPKGVGETISVILRRSDGKSSRQGAVENFVGDQNVIKKSFTNVDLQSDETCTSKSDPWKRV